MINLAAKITNAPGRTYIYWSEGARTEPRTEMPLFAGKVEICPDQAQAMERVRKVMRLRGYKVIAVVVDGSRVDPAEVLR